MENNERIIKNLLSLGNKIFLFSAESSEKKVALGKIIRFVKGRKPHVNGTLQLPYISIDGATSGKYILEYADDMVLCNKYDVLMVMDGASSGTIFSGQSGIVSSTFARIETVQEFQEIVFWFLYGLQDSIGQQNTGSAIPHANKEYINSLLLPIPADDNIQLQLRTLREKIFILHLENTKFIELKRQYLKKFFY